jgi:putative transposase
VVRYVQTSHGYSERRACSVTGQHRSTQRKPLVKDRRLALRQRMHEIVRTRVRYGYRWSCFGLVERGFAAIGPAFRTEPD